MSQHLCPNDRTPAVHAIILRDGMGYFHHDHAVPGDGVWHTFRNGNVTGISFEVIYAVEMPHPEEVYYETERDPERNDPPDETEGDEEA